MLNVILTVPLIDVEVSLDFIILNGLQFYAKHPFLSNSNYVSIIFACKLKYVNLDNIRRLDSK